MAEYRTNPTWALLLGSDLPEGSEKKVLQMLGSVVSDFEHPLHEIIWRPVTGKNQELKGVLRVEDGDFRSIANGLTNNEVKLQLTEAVWGKFASGKKNEQKMSAKTVITRTLENHRVFFEEIERQSGADILKMIANNPRKDTPYALMIVGIKTCIDSEISSKTEFSSQVDVGVSIHLDKIFKAAGLPVPIDATIDLNKIKEQLAEVFTTYSAKGERIFAIQYRVISVHTTTKWTPFPEKQKMSRYDDILPVPANRGLYGDTEEDTDEDEDAEGQMTNVEERNGLELREGLEFKLSKPGEVYITEL